MKVEKIKPVPKYIVERVRRYDKENLTCAPGHTRFYSYLTKNDGELVKVTVAVKNHYKQWLYKQVAVHGLNSKECFVKDMVFYYIDGYQVCKNPSVGTKVPLGALPKINISIRSRR